MATPSIRPQWRDRYLMIGDTIPMSLPAGAGGGGNRAYVDMSDTVGYAAGTRVRAFQEPATSGGMNRSSWALMESTAWLYEKEIAVPYVEGGTTGAPIQYFDIVETVYLGADGATAGLVNKVTDVLDGNWDELDVGGTQVVATDITVEDQPDNPGNYISCYPAPLPAVGSGAVITVVNDGGSSYALQCTGLVNAQKGICLINYDQWLRGIRSGVTAEIEAAFATITTFTNNTQFKIHRNLVPAVPGATDWRVDDTIFITHFAYRPRVPVNVVVPGGQGYKVVVGRHSCLGLLPEDAITSLKVRTSEERSHELEEYIRGGLDAPYDRLGVGPAGSGRVIDVDAGPVFADIGADGEFGFMSGTDGDAGTIGFLSYPTSPNANTGMVAAFKMTPAPGPETVWGDPETASATANPNEVQLTGGGQVRDAGGDSDIFLGVDLVYLDDGSGNPVDLGKAPNGIYIIDSLVSQTAFTVKYLDGTSPGAVMAGVGEAVWIRPTFVGSSGILSGKVSNIVAAVGAGALIEAQSSYTNYDFTSATEGTFHKMYVGNINGAVAVQTDTFTQDTLPTDGDHYFHTRRMGLVGDTYNDSEQWEEFVGKADSGVFPGYTLEGYMGYIWREAVGGTRIPGFAQHGFTEAAAPFITMMNGVFPVYGFGSLYDSIGNEVSWTGHVLGFPTQIDINGPIVLPPAGDRDSGALVAYYPDVANDKTFVGIQATFDNAADKFTRAGIRETPIAGAPAGLPEQVDQTPVSTYSDTPEHRFELHENANYGFRKWRYMRKVINASLAAGCYLNGTVVTSWVFRTYTIAVQDPPMWVNETDDVNDYLLFPILIPHGAQITAAACRYYCDQPLNVGGGHTPAEFSVIEVDTTVGDTGAGATALIIGGAATSMDPFTDSGGAAGAQTYGYNAGGGFHQVDLNNHDYYARVQCGQNLVGSKQTCMAVQVTFRQIDIFPE